MRTKVIVPIAAGVLLALSGAANAATKTTAFTVTATVAKNCIISAANLALGAFDGATDLTSTSNITVRCTTGAPYAVALNAGSGTFANRTMTNGTDTLVYNLYTTNGYGTVWGDGTSSTSTVSGSGAGMAAGNELTHVVYGRLLASANTGAVGVPGTYTDTITATITY
jgi:spore coat protein U-like protein